MNYKFRLILLFLIFFPGASWAITVTTFGGGTCQEYLRAVNESNQIGGSISDLSYFDGWIVGFMIGYNASGVQGKDLLGAMDNKTIVDWTFAYCKKNESSDLYNAEIQLIDKLVESQRSKNGQDKKHQR